MCGSDRSIQVFDMNKGEIATVLPDAHSRAAHCISQNKVSSYYRYCNNNLIIIHYHIAKKPQESFCLNQPHRYFSRRF